MSNKYRIISRGAFAAFAAAFLAFGAPKASAQINLVQNPGFETGNFDDWITMNALPLDTDYGVDSGAAHSGSFGAYFASIGVGDFDSITQNIHTVAGGKYKLSFWLANDPSDPSPAEFQALWNGKVVFTTSNTGFAYTKETVKGLVGNGGSTPLTFEGYQLPAAYSLDDILLTPLSFTIFALTPNQHAVAANLDLIANSNDPRGAALINFLGNQPNLPFDFDLISPAGLTSIFEISRSFADVQAGNMENHFTDLRSSYVPQDNGTTVLALASDGKSTVDAKDSKNVSSKPEVNKWNLWMDGSGDFVRVNGDGNAPGYNFDTGGVTLGADYRVCDHFVVGLMGGYANTGDTLTQGGSVDVNSGRLGIYATAFDHGFYVNALAAGGYNSYDTHRPGLGGFAQGSTDGEEYDGLLDGGYEFKEGRFTLGPVVSTQYTHVGLNSFTEGGSLAPLSIPSQSQDSLRTNVGFKISTDCTCHGMKVTPTLTAGWQHEYLDSTSALDSQFASGAGNIFTVQGPHLGRDSVVVNAGVSVQVTERVSTYVYYEGELGRANYELNSVTGGVKVGF